MALFRALYLAAFNVRPLAVIPLYAARTFLPLLLGGDCLASFNHILPRYQGLAELNLQPSFIFQTQARSFSASED